MVMKLTGYNFYKFKPTIEISSQTTNLTGINDQMVADGFNEYEGLMKIKAFFARCVHWLHIMQSILILVSLTVV